MNNYKKLFKDNRPMMFHTYACDTAGCGAIRTWFPNLLLNQWKKYRQIFATWGYNLHTDMNIYKAQAFIKFQRPAELTHLNFIKFFIENIKKQTNTPLIIEFDDRVDNIPSTNHAANYYKEKWPYIKEMLSLADGITVSTNVIKKAYQKYNDNISIVPNSLPRYMWFDPKFRKSKNKKFTILYSGSFNHFNQYGKGGDFGSELINFIKKTKNYYNWIFLGGYPHELDDIKEDITILKWKTIFEYPKFLKSLNVDIGIAPLEHNEFNRAKSDLKMLEYTALGIPGIYSDLDPYKNANLKFNFDEECIHFIERLYNDIDKRKEVWENDYNSVKDHLWLEDNLENWVNKHLHLFGKEL